MNRRFWKCVAIPCAFAAGVIFFSAVSVSSQEQDSPATKTAVMQAQRELGAFGYDAGVVDGAVGAKTVTALKKFQSDHKLLVTGKLDADTLTALDKAATALNRSERTNGAKPVDPREAEDAEWKSATEKDTPAAYWEFNRKFPNSDRVRVEHGRIATTVAYINAGNGMEAHAFIAIGGERFPITTNQMQQWRFVRYEHVGNFLAPETGGSIENGTAILVKEDDGRYKIVDVQGTVEGGGTDPFKPSLQLNGNAIRSGGLQWQLEASAKTMTWDEAKTYCSGFNDGGGVWRLPTEQELLALYSAKYSILNGNKEYEIITSLGSGRYWSSSVGTESADDAQEVNFDDGSTH